MDKKIIVAGAGHGGVAAAALLSKAGFDVTVYERLPEEKLGHDWFDAINPAVFKVVGCPHPEEVGIPWKWRADVTYFGPNTSDEHKIPQRFKKPQDIEIIMERRDIYRLLCGYAKECGVRFVYETTIKGPIVEKNRVTGISTDKGDFFADLIIDAAGLNSVLRTKLPDEMHIQKQILKNERIFTYRAFYDLPVDPNSVEDVFKVMFDPDPGEFSLSWIYTQEDYTDLLIGHIVPPTEEEIETIAETYRKTNPQLGKNRFRGGQTVPIPFRRPLSVLVADGYAAIGDAAFMTMPLNCSGMSVSIETAKILADAIIADETKTFSAETLWKYQYDFYHKIGKNMAPIALVKDMIISLRKEQIDYAFDRGIITRRELSITAYQHSIWEFLHFDPKLIVRGFRLLKDKELTKKACGVVADAVASFSHMGRLPKKYDRDKVVKWADKYDEIYTRRLSKLFPEQAE
ncbi:MAG: NAD(P)-binding protein [Clostridia bacterium]|nr:NAD(P)-binding protein [Clostridia bacterium]